MDSLETSGLHLHVFCLPVLTPIFSEAQERFQSRHEESGKDHWMIIIPTFLRAKA